MNDETKYGPGWLLFLGILGVALGIAAVSFLFRKSAAPALIKITTDSNGAPQVLGLSLANTNVRDKAFVAMRAAGMKGKISLTTTASNNTQVSNLVETLNSMNRAGLLNTNKPPNPYE